MKIGITIVIAEIPLKAQEKWQEAQRKATWKDNGNASEISLSGVRYHHQNTRRG